MGQVITGKCPSLIRALEEAGILPLHCRRIIIDINYDDAVTLYYECFADTKMLEIDFAKHLSPLIQDKPDDEKGTKNAGTAS